MRLPLMPSPTDLSTSIQERPSALTSTLIQTHATRRGTKRSTKKRSGQVRCK